MEIVHVGVDLGLRVESAACDCDCTELCETRANVLAHLPSEDVELPHEQRIGASEVVGKITMMRL